MGLWGEKIGPSDLERSGVGFFLGANERKKGIESASRLSSVVEHVNVTHKVPGSTPGVLFAESSFLLFLASIAQW